jgi:transmembrane sensor
MSVRTESNQIVRDQAAHWSALLNSGETLSQGELRSFHSWLEVPSNARAFNEYQSMVVLIQDLPTDKRATLLSTLGPRDPRFPGLRALFAQPFKLTAAAAALAAFAAFASWLVLKPAGDLVSHTYTTNTGEERTIVLPDGSVANLNTQSRLRWIGTPKERHVSLERGEVFFRIAHDVSRPFRVTVGTSEIRDLATEFDVYRKASGSVLVTVLSGQVVVKELTTNGGHAAWTERLVRPNEQMEYTPATLIADVHSVAAEKSVLWREGLLELEGQSFTTIVGELNRYSTKQILVADPRIDASQAKFSGTLNIHDMPSALKHIQELQPIEVTDTGDSYVLTYKADASVATRADATQRNGAGRK